MRHKTLQELEGDDWGEPKHTTWMVKECCRLRRVPLKDFTVGNLRLMTGQEIGLDYLVPLAIEVLSDNPLVEGSYYPGDLLSNVIEVSEEFWSQHPELQQKVKHIVQQALTQIEAGDADEMDEKDLLEFKQRLIQKAQR